MITIDGKQIKLQIWDTVSIAQIPCMTSVKAFYKSTLCVCSVLMLFYDCYGLLNTCNHDIKCGNRKDSFLSCNIFNSGTLGVRCRGTYLSKCSGYGI